MRPPRVSTSSASTSVDSSVAERLRDIVEAGPRIDHERAVRAAIDFRASLPSCSSSISPTIISTMSSIEARPSVPPYSSMTSAICVRVVCILTSRSSAGIDGGTKRTGRRMPAFRQGRSRRSRVSPGAAARLSLKPSGRASAGDEIDEDRGCGPCRADRRDSRHDRQARMAGGAEHRRALPARSRHERHGDDVGARNHDVLDAHLVQRASTFVSIARSSGEKPAAVGDFLDRFLHVVAHRAAAEAEAAPRSRPSRLLPVPDDRDRCSSRSGAFSDRSRLTLIRVARNDGPRKDPRCRARRESRAPRPPFPPPGIGLVIITDEMQKAVHDEMRQHDLRTVLPSRLRLARHVSKAIVMSPRTAARLGAPPAGKDSTLVGGRLPRHCALSSRIAASSASKQADLGFGQKFHAAISKSLRRSPPRPYEATFPATFVSDSGSYVDSRCRCCGEARSSARPVLQLPARGR